MNLMAVAQISEELVLTDFEAVQKISIKIFFRLLIDLVSLWLLLSQVYFKVYKRKDLYFTFYVFNLVIFLITFLLNKVELSMGAAFGLFAVFSMLRYKTEEISIKDMTYLFLVIAMGLINAIAKIKDANDYYEYAFLVLIQIFIIAVAYFLERKIDSDDDLVQTINYDNLDLIKPNDYLKLLEDVKSRTGLNVKRITISKIDLTKNSVQLKVYYSEIN
jgi:hypothetical protein